MHNDYRQVATALEIERCPCCAEKPQLWHYSETPTEPVQHVVMCPNNGDEGLGETRNGLIGGSGCLLADPPKDFYRESDREAIAYWNNYARELREYRAERESK